MFGERPKKSPLDGLTRRKGSYLESTIRHYADVLSTGDNIWKVAMVIVSLVLIVMRVVSPESFLGMKWSADAAPLNKDVAQQIAELDRVKASLSSLTAFVENQKEEITSEQENLSKLTQERADLEPIVQMNRGEVNQLFRLQEERVGQQKGLDLFLGFLVGVFSSASASLLMSAIQRKRHPIKIKRETGCVGE